MNHGIGEKGDSVTTNRFIVEDFVKVENGELVITTGMFDQASFHFKLDGWIGRYGMPLEFLLATHLSTMAPDLSLNLATQFNTDVEILLHKTKGDMNGGLRLTNNNQVIEKKDFAEQADGFWDNVGDFLDWEALEEVAFEPEDVYKIFEKYRDKGLHSLTSSDTKNESFICTGPSDKDINTVSVGSVYNDEIYTNYTQGDSKKVDELYNMGTIEDKVIEQLKNFGLEVVDDINSVSTEGKYVNKSDVQDMIKAYKDSSNTTAGNSSDSGNSNNNNNSSSPTEVKYTIVIDGPTWSTEGYDPYNQTQHYNYIYWKMECGKKTPVEHKKGPGNYNLYQEAKDFIEKINTEIGSKYSPDSYAYGGTSDLDKLSGNLYLHLVGNEEWDKLDKGTIEVDGKTYDCRIWKDTSTSPGTVLASYKEDKDVSSRDSNSRSSNPYKWIGKEYYKDEKGELKSKDININIQVDTNHPAYPFSVGINYKVEQKNENGNKIKCSDIENTTGSVCDECFEFVKTIYKAMNELNNENISVYIPYINRVTDHWFRNVYFSNEAIKEAVDDKEETGIIQTDTEYEKATGERWTKYEMYDNGSKYELYVYNPEFIAWNGKGNAPEEFKKDGSKYLVLRENKGKGSYKLSDDGVTYEKESNGDYELYWIEGNNHDNTTKYDGDIEDFRVGKKALTQSMASVFKTGSAYSFKPNEGSSEWKKASTTNSEMNINAINEVKDMEIVYQANYGTMEQTEDGVRGETNAKIKKLFLDDYYIYDGSKERAGLIAEAKLRVKKYNNANGTKYDYDDPDSFRKLADNGEIKSVITSMAAMNGNEYQKASIDDISGPVNLTHDALAAFSILTNMHTLDAEFIYHDFKELVVELNYFDKEDLVEGEDDVMMFPLASSSAAGWPETRYDKNEAFYGTLIQSAEDIGARKEETRLTQIKQFGLDGDIKEGATEDEAFPNNGQNEGPSEIESSDGKSSLKKCTDNTCANVITVNGVTYKHFSQCSKVEWSTWNPDLKKLDGKDLEGGCGICSTTSILTGYGVDIDPYGVCKKKDELGLKWYPDGGQRATNIEKILKSYGIKGEWKTVNSASEIKKILEDSFTQGKPVICRISSSGSIWTTGSGHYFAVLGVDCDGNLYTADSARGSNYDNRLVNSGGIDALANDIAGHLNSPGIFVFDDAPSGFKPSTSDSSGSDAEFPGFEGGEPVLAPATGEVIKYGTVSRKNVVTGNDDTVGFIKIRLLGSEEAPITESAVSTYFGRAQSDGSYTIGGKDYLEENDPKGWLEKKYKNETKRGKVGYDYFWSEYKDAGISDSILYIEGFDVSEVLGGNPGDDKGKGKKNINKLAEFMEDNKGQYNTLYEVPNLLDDTKEFELKVGEEAKKEAVDFIKEGDKLYIKEGAVIGKTYTEDDPVTEGKEIEILDEEATKENQEKSEDGNFEVVSKQEIYNLGNYMRMILRDTNDEVIENIEDYIEIPEEGGGSNKTGNGKGVQELEAIDDNSNASVKDKVIAMIDYFMDQGFTFEAACGIVGNVYQESGLNTKSQTGKYFGIFQMDTGNRNAENPKAGSNWKKILDWMQDNGYNYDSFAGQVRGIIECEGYLDGRDYWGNKEEMQVLTDEQDAADYWEVWIEGAYDVHLNLPEEDRSKYGPLRNSNPHYAKYQQLGKRKKLATDAKEIYNGTKDSFSS